MKLVKFVPDNTNIGFVAVRNWAFALTALLTILAVGATAWKGLNLGVDFVGGLMIEQTFPSPPDLEKVRAVVARQNVGEASAIPRPCRSGCPRQRAPMQARPTPSSPRYKRR